MAQLLVSLPSGTGSAEYNLKMKLETKTITALTPPSKYANYLVNMNKNHSK